MDATVPEWSEDELRIVTVDDCRDAINSVLKRAMVYNGKVDVSLMERAQIDYAIHLLRYYRALAWETPALPGGTRLTVALPT